jgi:CSLREA domain-containing protein
MRARTGVVLAAVAVAFGAAANAHAVTFVVTRGDDPAPGACDSDCSLREAVLAANAGPGGDAIELPPGRVRLGVAGPGEDAAATGDLDLAKSVLLTGAGARATIVDAAGLDRVFDVGPGATALLADLTITGGAADDDGGGIRNAGALTLLRTTVTGNEARVATSRNGGGIASSGTLVVTQSTIAANRAVDGGGIDFTGTLSLTNSTIAVNVAGGPGSTGGGGGIHAGTGAALNAANTTVAGNVAFGGAGSGGGIEAPSATLANSIVANNLANASDQSATFADNCAVGTLTSQGHNLSNGSDCGLTGTGDRQATDARLGPLADNGGPTDTEAPPAGSPAIDAGAGCPGLDQRGLSRPRGGACDIGAYELAPPVVATAAAGRVGLTSAVLAATVDPGLRETSFRFEYGTTTAYGSLTLLQWAGAGNGALPVTALLTGLRPGTTYHFRVVATNPDGAAAGADQSFTTLDRTKPVLSLLRVSPGIFRPARGTTISFRLSEDATVTFKADRVLRGIRRGGRCVAGPRRRRFRPCTRYVPVRGSLVETAHAGQNSFHFDAKLSGRPLAAGAYRLDATPRDDAGNIGKTVVAAFRVRR